MSKKLAQTARHIAQAFETLAQYIERETFSPQHAERLGRVLEQVGVAMREAMTGSADADKCRHSNTRPVLGGSLCLDCGKYLEGT